MSRFIWPVTHNVSQAFGANAAYYGRYGQKGHNGIDLAVPVGTPIKASTDGVVVFEGYGKNGVAGLASWGGDPAGIWTLVDHGDVYTGYAHQSKTVVSAGQKVKQGQVIGYSGATGDASGPHVHFEFIQKPPSFSNGYAARLDPAKFKVGVDPVATKAVKEEQMTAVEQAAMKVGQLMTAMKPLGEGTIVFEALNTTTSVWKLETRDGGIKAARTYKKGQTFAAVAYIDDKNGNETDRYYVSLDDALHGRPWGVNREDVKAVYQYK